MLALSAVLVGSPLFAGAAKSKKKGAKKKGYDYERSKYKSKDLNTAETHSYRFNAKGEPVEAKKKAAAKKKRSSEPPEADALGAPACGADESCKPKPSEA